MNSLHRKMLLAVRSASVTAGEGTPWDMVNDGRCSDFLSPLEAVMDHYGSKTSLLIYK